MSIHDRNAKDCITVYLHCHLDDHRKMAAWAGIVVSGTNEEEIGGGLIFGPHNYVQLQSAIEVLRVLSSCDRMTVISKHPTLTHNHQPSMHPRRFNPQRVSNYDPRDQIARLTRGRQVRWQLQRTAEENSVLERCRELAQRRCMTVRREERK